MTELDIFSSTKQFASMSLQEYDMYTNEIISYQFNEIPTKVSIPNNDKMTAAELDQQLFAVMSPIILITIMLLASYIHVIKYNFSTKNVMGMIVVLILPFTLTYVATRCQFDHQAAYHVHNNMENHAYDDAQSLIDERGKTHPDYELIMKLRASIAEQWKKPDPNNPIGSNQAMFALDSIVETLKKIPLLRQIFYTWETMSWLWMNLYKILACFFVALSLWCLNFVRPILSWVWSTVCSIATVVRPTPVVGDVSKSGETFRASEVLMSPSSYVPLGYSGRSLSNK